MLKLSENQRDLGRIRIGQPKSFSINVINTGSEAAEITSIKRGCGKCTQALMNKTTIPANSSEPLRITFTPDSTGIARKSVTLNGQLIFTFTAQVFN